MDFIMWLLIGGMWMLWKRKNESWRQRNARLGNSRLRLLRRHGERLDLVPHHHLVRLALRVSHFALLQTTPRLRKVCLEESTSPCKTAGKTIIDSLNVKGNWFCINWGSLSRLYHALLSVVGRRDQYCALATQLYTSKYNGVSYLCYSKLLCSCDRFLTHLNSHNCEEYVQELLLWKFTFEVCSSRGINSLLGLKILVLKPILHLFSRLNTAVRRCPSWEWRQFRNPIFWTTVDFDKSILPSLTSWNSLKRSNSTTIERLFIKWDNSIELTYYSFKSIEPM